MHVTVTGTAMKGLQADALVLTVPEGTGATQLAGLLAEADAALSGAIGRVIADGLFAGKNGQVETLYPMTGLGAPRIVLVGLGKDALTVDGWRKAVSDAVNAVAGKSRRVALVLPEGLEPAVAAEAGAEAAVLSAYEFKPYMTEKDDDDRKIEAIELVAPGQTGLDDAVARGASMAATVCWVRDLSNLPGNKLNVVDLVREALEAGKEDGLTVTVREYDQLVAEGFGCLTAVGRGSVHKPAFVEVIYRGAGDAAPVALVGKGITYDTGGICIKPRAGMEEMKTDMHGAATVLGVLKMAAERQLPVNLVGLLSIAENMPNGDAVKPGDIVKSYNGTTIEILDTDAEGRLVLADGIGFAVKNHKPRAVIDIATLTGSIIMALAYEATGLFTNNDDLHTQLTASGNATGERVWRFPTWDAYAANTKSDIADLANVGKAKGDAITAAMFLKTFAGDTPWVHLDIAGSSFIHEPKPYRPKGSTGVGVRLLTHWLESQVAK